MPFALFQKARISRAYSAAAMITRRFQSEYGKKPGEYYVDKWGQSVRALTSEEQITELQKALDKLVDAGVANVNGPMRSSGHEILSPSKTVSLEIIWFLSRSISDEDHESLRALARSVGSLLKGATKNPQTLSTLLEIGGLQHVKIDYEKQLFGTYRAIARRLTPGERRVRFLNDMKGVSFKSDTGRFLRIGIGARVKGAGTDDETIFRGYVSIAKHVGNNKSSPADPEWRNFALGRMIDAYEAFVMTDPVKARNVLNSEIEATRQDSALMGADDQVCIPNRSLRESIKPFGRSRIGLGTRLSDKKLLTALYGLRNIEDGIRPDADEFRLGTIAGNSASLKKLVI